jgi:predicted HicB family RNase H-like nuclease
MNKPVREQKTTTLLIRMKPSVKALVERRAQQENRSLANFIEQLIVADAKRKSSSPKD